ncbi:MAG: hypothetical protein ACYTGN_14535 [Planctomycetota bacterium]|jgi:hypothetical protein
MVRTLLFLALACALADADERAYPRFNFALDVPGLPWKFVEDPTPKAPLLFKAELAQDTGRMGVSVVVVAVVREADLAEAEYRDGLKSGMLKSMPGMKVVSEKQYGFAGVPAYEIRFEGVVGTTTLRIKTVSMIADERQYNLSIAVRGKDVTADPALEKAVASFRFIEEPLAPEDYNSLAFRIGESIGVIALVVLVLGAVFAVRKLIRR